MPQQIYGAETSKVCIATLNWETLDLVMPFERNRFAGMAMSERGAEYHPQTNAAQVLNVILFVRTCS